MGLFKIRNKWQDCFRRAKGVVVQPEALKINLFVVEQTRKVVQHYVLKEVGLKKDFERGLVDFAKLIIYFNNMDQ